MKKGQFPLFSLEKHPIILYYFGQNYRLFSASIGMGVNKKIE